MKCWLFGHDYRVSGCDEFGHYGCHRCWRRCICGKIQVGRNVVDYRKKLSR